MKRLKNQKGFTLIEMLIVMLIITVLIAIAIPNVSKQTSAVDTKGCQAFVQMVQGQVESYRMDKRAVPASVDELVTEGYLKADNKTCPNGEVLTITDGVVSSSEPAA